MIFHLFPDSPRQTEGNEATQLGAAQLLLLSLVYRKGTSAMGAVILDLKAFLEGEVW